MTLECYRCDATDEAADLDVLPHGWETRDSTAIGPYPICPACAARDIRPSSSEAVGQAKSRLRTIVERVERIEEDMATMRADRAEIYAEAKGEGYDVKILRKIITERRKDPAKRQEEQDLFDTYASAIGGLF